MTDEIPAPPYARDALAPVISAGITFDARGHAFYIAYRNAHLKYLQEIWEIGNWDFIGANFD